MDKSLSFKISSKPLPGGLSHRLTEVVSLDFTNSPETVVVVISFLKDEAIRLSHPPYPE
ncbi:hypothetical protein ISO77_11340 [Morganella morganii subsp. morganii]|uniref:hypothetical protein n=1 Tax=Morganella morganii TaxID=582 RepID=UPI001BD97774|nr:hypothetical protein [Morganella morganii]MBT0396124.1 hypothetical protein [Morganella morganii subsp. morganii]